MDTAPSTTPPATSSTPLVSVVTPCFNEEENVREVVQRVKAVFAGLGAKYRYEHIFIDNASSDRTVAILKEIAADDRNVKIIVNTRNFGVYRSPMHAYRQTSGAAMIPLVADLQDPPELIPELLQQWERGFKLVAAVKKGVEEGAAMAAVRSLYYRVIDFLSETEQVRDFTGFGLYDREAIELILSTGEHYPHMRGLVGEMGFPIARVEYFRPERKRGLSKNRIYDLYIQAMNGIVAHSKLPLRLATFAGFMVAFLSILVAVGYLAYKLLYWQQFEVGLAPVVIGMFFLGAIQLIFLGIIGEYIGVIHSRIFQRWLVIERERVNFDEPMRPFDGRALR
jgi:glycosyltransferase involved in cell wall biosynthesis